MLIALQDNFNSILNKKEAIKQQEKQQELDDKITQMKLLDTLQKSIAIKIDELIQDGKNKNDIYNNNIKNELIDNIITDGYYVNKKSKFYNIKYTKYILLSNYERTAKKQLQLLRLKDKENEHTTTASAIATAPPKTSIFDKIIKIILYIIIGIISIFIGFIGAICKNIK